MSKISDKVKFPHYFYLSTRMGIQDPDLLPYFEEQFNESFYTKYLEWIISMDEIYNFVVKQIEERIDEEE